MPRSRMSDTAALKAIREDIVAAEFADGYAVGETCFAVGNAEGEGFAGSGRPQKQDIALLDLHAIVLFAACNTFIMIIYRNR